MVTVAGIAAAIDLRLLGVAPGIPTKPLSRLFPIMWIGFAISAITGLILTVIDATTKLYNPDFYLKMAFIFAAIWILVAVRKSLTDVPVSGRTKAMAWASLFCWFAAIATGRLLAYLGPVSGGFGSSNH
jgi:hypothetical protein